MGRIFLGECEKYYILSTEILEGKMLGFYLSLKKSDNSFKIAIFKTAQIGLNK